MSNEKPSPILKLELGVNGTYTFYTDDEISSWISTEYAFYTPLLAPDRNDSTSADIAKRLRGLFNQLHRWIDPSRVDDQNHYNQLLSLLQTNFPATGFPTSQSPRGRFIADLLNNGQLLGAAYVIAYYIGTHIQTINATAIRELIRAVNLDIGIASSNQPAVDALNALHAKWSELLDKSIATERKLKSDHEAEIENQNTAIADHKAQLDTTIQNTKDRLENQLGEIEKQLTHKLEDAESRLKAVEKTYDEKLALQSAVTYWEKKAKSHKCWAIVWGILSAITAGFATWFILISAKQTLGTTKITDAQLYQVSELALIAIFGVWLMRVLVRLMLSNTHLHTDASERRTMMLTYLAMMREGQLPEGNSRDLILQALFRPTSTGIIKDDASPPFMAEWLKCTVGKE